MTTVTFEPTKVVFVAESRPDQPVGAPALEGDFAQGMRTLPMLNERSDYARGLRTLPMDLDIGPDFARGQRQGPLDSRLRGDFATGQRKMAEPGR